MKASLILTVLCAATVPGAPPPPPNSIPAAAERHPVLVTAAYPGQAGVEAMCGLLQSGADVNTRSADGFTPLMVAANWGNTEMVRFLLAAGADANATTHAGTNALHSVACAEIIHTTHRKECEQALKDIAAMLLAAGADINQATPEGITPLMVATKHRSVLVEPFLQAGAGIPQPGDVHFRKHINELMQSCGILTLVEHGLDANYQADNGLSVLQMAVAQRNEKAVAALLAKGANANHIGGGATVLWHTMHHKSDTTPATRLAIARQLLNAGADPLQYDNNGDTLLHSCASLGDLPLLQFILQRYPHAANVRSESNNTPLHLAAHKADIGMIQCLIGAGADVNAINSTAIAQLSGNGFCVAAMAAGSTNKDATEALELLLSAGAGFDAAAQKNIMHAALNTGTPQMVSLLLSKGIRADTRLAHGVPLLQIATNNDNPAVVKLLLAAGADANAANDAGLTALHWVVQRHLTEANKSIILALLKAGANLYHKDHAGRTPWDCAPPATQQWLLWQISH